MSIERHRPRNHWLFSLITAGALVGLGGCGGDPVGTREVAPLKAQVAHAEARLPSAPRGHLSGDGFGGDQRTAVLDARRAVSEQLDAKIRAEVRASEREDNGRVDQSSSLRMSSSSAFEHAELIRTHAVVARPGGFAARAVLDRDEAAEVYRAELAETREALARLGPLVRRALEQLDATILLSAEHAPGLLLARIAHQRRMLGLLDRPAPGDATPGDAVALARAVAPVRAKTRIDLMVRGAEDRPRLRAAVLREVGAMLGARGCRFEPGAHRAPEAGAPWVHGVLDIRGRDHEEAGLRWRYVAFDVALKDARSGRPIFQFFSGPDFAHGGGQTWAQADRSAARRLAEVLPKKGGERFAALVCR